MTMKSGGGGSRAMAEGKERGRTSGGGNRSGGGTGRGDPSSDQRHRNRLAEIDRVARATGTSATPVGNTGVSMAGRVSSALQGMARDYRDVGNTPVENFGNRLASLMGFNQQRPTMQGALDRVNQTPTGQVTDRRAGWGFDPAGLIGSALGMATGIPFGPGLVFDQLSQMAGRPMEIGMGPSVFGGGPSGGSFSTASGAAPGRVGGTGMGGADGRVAIGGRPAPGVLAPPPQPTPPASPPGAPGGGALPPMPQFQWAQPWPGQGVLAPSPKQWSWGSWG